MKMFPQKLISEWKVSRGVVKHVERKSPLHDKRVFNNNLMFIKLTATYVVSNGKSNNEEQRVEG